VEHITQTRAEGSEKKVQEKKVQKKHSELCSGTLKDDDSKSFQKLFKKHHRSKNFMDHFQCELCSSKVQLFNLLKCPRG
jgi:hypothetical protein